MQAEAPVDAPEGGWEAKPSPEWSMDQLVERCRQLKIAVPNSDVHWLAMVASLRAHPFYAAVAHNVPAQQSAHELTPEITRAVGGR